MVGRVKLHRKMKHREWYTDANPARLFFHCLINANHKQKTWRGVEIKRGQFVTSSESLAVELGLSRQQIRTAIDKLVSTNEITSEATNTYTIITVLKYCDYQGSDDDEQPTDQPAKQQTDNQPYNQRITTTKEGKEYKKEKKKEKKFFIPPSLDDVITYFKEKGYKESTAIKAFNGYDVADWHDSKGNKILNWKQKMNTVRFNPEHKEEVYTLPDTDLGKAELYVKIGRPKYKELFGIDETAYANQQRNILLVR